MILGKWLKLIFWNLNMLYLRSVLSFNIYLLFFYDDIILILFNLLIWLKFSVQKKKKYYDSHLVDSNLMFLFNI